MFVDFFIRVVIMPGMRALFHSEGHRFMGHFDRYVIVSGIQIPVIDCRCLCHFIFKHNMCEIDSEFVPPECRVWYYVRHSRTQSWWWIRERAMERERERERERKSEREREAAAEEAATPTTMDILFVNNLDDSQREPQLQRTNDKADWYAYYTQSRHYESEQKLLSNAVGESPSRTCRGWCSKHGTEQVISNLCMYACMIFMCFCM